MKVPGKLVILGEYAVLDGGGALVAAVNRGVACEVRPGEGLEVPGTDDRFVRAALGWDGLARWGQATKAWYRFSDWNPPALTTKAGFGGSAAAVVAARQAAGLPLSDAYAIHRFVQGGGSGIDVFASLNGGCRSFPSGMLAELPPMIAVWSGQSASTGPRVERYRAWAGREAFVERSNEILEQFSMDPFAALSQAYANLCAMAMAAGLDYDTPAHRDIHRLACAFGGSAKPSGAGGGDVAVALLPDPAALAAFCRACETGGHLCIPVEIVPPSSWPVICP